jgi:hypothetical protein
MTRHSLAVAVVAAIVAGCGGSPSFSPISLAIDKTRPMGELTAAGQSEMCRELSAALTASFGQPKAKCMLNSRTIYLTYPQCQIEYDACVAANTPASGIDACTDQMSGMWDCKITVGQYEACFNAMNAAYFDQVMAGPACTKLPGDNPLLNEACRAAPCNYVWYD